MNRLLWTTLMLGILSCAPRRTDVPAGPLDEARLRAAAEAAGFRVLEARADIPPAARTSLTFTSIPYDDPRLSAVRDKYALEKVVRGARDEWHAQLLLMDWIHRAIPNGTPKVKATHAVDILDAAARGEAFWCTYFGITYVECALALGWQARKIAIDRAHGPEGLGSSHHGLAEVWSNRFRKWVAIDPQSNYRMEKNGLPLSAWEIRAEWLRNRGADVERIVGVPPNETRKNPARIGWEFPEDETSAFFWIYIIDHADMHERGARYILPQDAAHEGQVWYQNDYGAQRSKRHQGYERDAFRPTRRLEDAYWTVGLVEPSLAEAGAGSLRINLDSSLPDRAGYEATEDGTAWRRVGETFHWRLKPGENRLQVRALARPRGIGPEAAFFLRLEQVLAGQGAISTVALR